MAITLTVPNHSSGQPGYVGPLVAIAGEYDFTPVGATDRIRARVIYFDDFSDQWTLLDGSSGNLAGGAWNLTLGVHTAGVHPGVDRTAAAPDFTNVNIQLAHILPPYTSASYTDEVDGEFKWLNTGRFWEALLIGTSPSAGLAAVLAAVQRAFPATS